ncbi:MAG: DUF1501 domain-containing protein [Alphaproteobacteria bacterium]|nr:DUF1501 domain-containing protein [Alphaproteobacteria bacterium]
MALTRRAFLAGTTAGLAGTLLRSRAHAAASDATRLVIVTAVGGWDVSYAIDPKPGSALVDGPELDEDVDDPEDREAVTTFGGLDVMTNGVKRPAVSTFFERWHDRTALVRGIWVGSISHDACRVRMLTGTTTATSPDVGAMAAARLGADTPIPYMDLGGTAFTGPLAAISGRAGASNQLAWLLDRNKRLPGPTGTSYNHPLYVPDDPARADIQAWLDGQFAHTDARWRGHPGADARLDDWAVATERARRLRAEGADFATELGRGTASSLNGQVDVALDLLSSGLSRTVLVDSRLPWDTHQDNSDQHAHHQTLYAGLDRLASGLQAAGMLDDTVVVVMSEMTRTPRRNGNGGKDHWPVTSAMVFGGHVQGDRVLGASTDSLDAGPVDLSTGLADATGTPLRYDHFAAGLLAMLDADPGQWFPGTEALGGLAR